MERGDPENRPVWRDSLRLRLSAAFAGIVFAVFATASAFSIAIAYADSLRQLQIRLSGTAAVLASSIAEDLATGNAGGAQQSLTAIREIPDVNYALVEGADRKRFAEIGTGQFLDSDTGDVSEMPVLSLLSRRTVWASASVVRAGRQIGAVHLLADIAESRAATLRRVAYALLLSAASAVAAGLIGYRAIAALTAPLTQLSNLMVGFGRDKEFGGRAEFRARGEIGVLAKSFNTMLDLIEVRDREIADYQRNLEDKVVERTRELVVARDEAERANRAKSDFLSTMSHEIRTPMNGMLAMAELLSAAPLSEKHRRYAEIIFTSGRGLLGIINDILDLSKIESGRLELETVPFSPDDLLRGVLSLFDERARQKGLELSGLVDFAVPRQLAGDATRLGQVLTNLVNNALKFTETGGVSVDWIHLESERSGHCRMRIEVTDSGIGIAADKVASVFEQFEQADQSITRRFGGTGLGLSICKRLIERMGGIIDVDSEPGKGSRFWFEVELASVEAPVAAPIEKLTGLVGIAISANRLRAHLSQALDECGIDVKILEAGRFSSEGMACVICDDRRISDADGGGGPLVGVARMGDSWPDEALESGLIADLLSLPATRADIAELCRRIRSARFAGREASPGRPGAGAYLPDLKQIRILGVDDNPVNREILRDALSAMNANVRLAETGAQAISAAAEHEFDLILMDVSMPDMDGYEATRRIRTLEQARGQAKTPVIALTGNVAGDGPQAWRDAGMDAYLTKPFTIASLARAIGDHVPTMAAETSASTSEAGALSDWISAATLKMLETLSRQNGSDMADRIFSMFIEHADPAAKALEADLQAREGLGIARSAHAFKSMCHSAGAVRLAAILERIENQAKAGKIDEAREAGKTIAAALDNTIDAMDAFICRIHDLPGRPKSARCLRPPQIQRPPSTSRITPVMNSASSETR